MTDQIQTKTKKNIALTIDLEEWWGVESFKKYYKNHPTPTDDRIEESVDRILKIADDNSLLLNFFILGRVAEKYPYVIEKISNRGHLIGSHGYSHTLIYSMTPKSFEDDLISSMRILEEITNKKTVFYRAPSYSITKKSKWALEILKDNGILLDSSIVPTKNSRFGIKDTPEVPYSIVFDDNSSILEVPPNIFKWRNYSLPLASGFAFRLFPGWFIDYNYNKFEIKGDVLPMIVLHNWEFDRDQPVLDLPMKNKIIHYHNLYSVERKFLQLTENRNAIGITDSIPMTQKSIGEL